MGSILLLALMFLLILGVVLLKDLLKAAVALAAASVILSVVLFRHGAWMAATFELSVCAGLITVLFVSTVSLTKDSDQNEESKISGYLLPAFLLFFIGIDFFAVKWIGKVISPATQGAQLIGGSLSGFSKVFWGERTTDILGQAGLTLAGVFAILALFKRKVIQNGSKHE